MQTNLNCGTICTVQQLYIILCTNKQLENLYYLERRFSIRILEAVKEIPIDIHLPYKQREINSSAVYTNATQINMSMSCICKATNWVCENVKLHSCFPMKIYALDIYFVHCKFVYAFQGLSG